MVIDHINQFRHRPKQYLHWNYKIFPLLLVSTTTAYLIQSCTNKSYTVSTSVRFGWFPAYHNIYLYCFFPKQAKSFLQDIDGCITVTVNDQTARTVIDPVCEFQFLPLTTTTANL